MTGKKNEAGISLPMIVTEGVTVNILPNEQYSYLMTTREVAEGYGTTKYAIFKAHSRNQLDFKEQKHFIKGVDILSTPGIQPSSILWTKAGIIRLGFFINSARAKLFRDWAEDLIVTETSVIPATNDMLPAKRKHNRLTQDRMVSILADVCLIEDKTLRMSITNKLMGGRDLI